MESNKFENDFRDKLKLREITPSENSWDRLDAMLTVAEKKQPKKSKDWLYIAASIIGFMLIATVFFSQTEELIDIKKSDVVIENKEIIKLTEEVLINKEEVSIINQKSVAKTNSNQIKSKKPNAIVNEEVVIKESENPLVSNEKATVEIILETIIQKNIPNEMVASTADAKPSIKVNAKNLLSEVDGELELTFREKMVQKVNKNFNTVKMALANRNQE